MPIAQQVYDILHYLPLWQAIAASRLLQHVMPFTQQLGGVNDARVPCLALRASADKLLANCLSHVFNGRAAP